MAASVAMKRVIPLTSMKNESLAVMLRLHVCLWMSHWREHVTNRRDASLTLSSIYSMHEERERERR